jgi:hypothetical protein
MFGKPSQPAKPAFVAEVQAAEKAPGDSEITPTPIVEKDLKKVLEQKPIVAEKEHPISLAAFSFNSSFTIIGLLLLILAIDLFFAIRLQIVRVSGRNLAHWLFLGSIAIALFIVKTGMIL